jgi:hypothetical protein
MVHAAPFDRKAKPIGPPAANCDVRAEITSRAVNGLLMLMDFFIFIFIKKIFIFYLYSLKKIFIFYPYPLKYQVMNG